jgi:hypothetical protein
VRGHASRRTCSDDFDSLTVTRGLDPRVHPLRKMKVCFAFREEMDCRVIRALTPVFAG